MAYFIEPHLERSFESVSVSFNRPIEAPSWLTAAMPGIVVSYASTSVTITNGDLLVRFSDSDGSIESFQSSAEPTPRKLQQAYFEYPSDNAWDNHYTFKSSGPATKIDRFAGSRYGVDCFHTQHQTSTQVSEIADLPIDSRAMDRYTLCVCVCLDVCVDLSCPSAIASSHLKFNSSFACIRARIKSRWWITWLPSRPPMS